MGQIMICNPNIAKKPYRIKMSATDVYSLEELCYYLYENLYILDDEILDTNLCSWLDLELKERQLSRILQKELRNNVDLVEFVVLILRGSGYCDEEEIKKATNILQSVKQMSSFEKMKLKCDLLAESRKYSCALYEYKKLLPKGTSEDEQIIIGKIYHNMGCCYANMFLFKEAFDCFSKAEKITKSTKSIYLMQKAGEYLNQTVRENTVDEDLYVENEFSKVMRGHNDEKKAAMDMTKKLSDDCRRMCMREVI